MAPMRDNQKKGVIQSVDWFTILLFLVLLGMGWLSICGACYDFEEDINLLAPGSRTRLQLMWMGVACGVGTLVMFTDDRLYDAFAYIIYALLLVLLFITPFLAPDIKGSHSWIKIGSFSFQSAEFAKFATSLAIAKYMGRYGFSLSGNWRNFVGCLLLIMLPMGLIVMQRETGSALVYFSLFLMLYREGMPGSILFSGIAAVIYFVVGIRLADVTALDGVTSWGEYLVIMLTLLFTAAMLYIYEPHSNSEREAHLSFYRRYQMMFEVITYGIGITALASLFSVYVRAFNVAIVQLIVTGAIIIRLILAGLLRSVYRYCYIGLFALGSLVLFYSAHTILYHVLEEHQQKRVLVLLGLKDDPKGTGYNVIQAQIAIGSGGLHGKGFLKGTQTKLKYVPEQETDFIFCTVGEEQGFAGSAGVLLLFMVLLLRIIHIAERQPYAFGRIYGYCVFSIFFFHVLINIGMVLGLAPVIGIPLPFFSYGGSSLIGFTLLLFILLRIDAGRNRLRR
ncbi:MAG: rod shape-determining protein RodA [Bacteroidaceae bacterium]|nr:rod shape-determining protein RodA [Bacteroidaceae bacterium]